MTAIPDEGDKSSPRSEINSVGVQEYATVYAGIRRTPDPDGTIVVFVAEDADVTAFTTRLAALIANGQITTNYRLTPVRRSYADLQKRTIVIAGDQEIQSQGIKLASVGPDIEHNKIRIRLLWEYSPTAAEYLINRYGSDWVTVDTTPQTFLPTFAV